MSLGQCIAAIEGWRRVHGAGEKPEPPPDEWYDRMKELHTE